MIDKIRNSSGFLVIAILVAIGVYFVMVITARYTYRVVVTYNDGQTKEFTVKSGEQAFRLNQYGCLEFSRGKGSESLTCNVRSYEVLSKTKAE